MQKAMLGALMTRWVFEGAMHALLKSLGYEAEDKDKPWGLLLNFGTRYVHKETGEKFVIPSPFNIGRRIMGKVRKRFGSEGAGYGNAASLWKVLQGDTAIMPKVAFETFISNTRWDGTPISNEYDTAQVKLLKQTV